MSSPLVGVDCEQSDEPKPQTKEEVKLLLKLVGPVMITTVLEFLPGFVAVSLAGNLESPYAQHYIDAATFSIMLINLTSFSVGLGLASALDTLCSQAYGAKRLEKIGVYFQTGMVVLGAILMPVFAINWFTEDVLLSLGQDAAVARLSGQFSRYMLIGIPFLYIYELLRKVLQAQNIMTPLVIIAAVGNAVNVAAGYGLAYHTSLGFNGIAIGCSLGNIVLPLMFVPYFLWRPHHLKQWWIHPWDFKAAMGYVRVFLRLGIPGMAMLVMEMWAFEALTIMSGLLPHHVVAVAAHSVLANVNLLVYTAFDGLSVAANIRVGNCLGGDMAKTARLACTLVLIMTVILSVTFTVILFGLSGQIPRLFLQDGESADLASKVLAIWSPLTIVDGLNAVMQGVLRGAGKQKAAAITNALAYYVFGIPLGALLAFQCNLGVEGLWLGMGFGSALNFGAMVALILCYWSWDKLATDAKMLTDL
ncbi:Multidrug/Oligosaccharidyl-lipid/Polysaccharide (MOP) Flippase transporter [Phytophthora megakarya]|uniref:Multidrug/Oligosaccharidyl-lipid/Polysaccharide (MOP) Flippase transporter n=1 Tax=Phytophthora megakarya TaxID=4795 RepID=A0A225WVY8_9STRA|nr:Multidrug/Oligosaccharidyl-lipid/Polysaccharide (MOP) Flippase transporter [Phytophthora megakarya]